jgi:hypothetical protein
MNGSLFHSEHLGRTPFYFWYGQVVGDWEGNQNHEIHTRDDIPGWGYRVKVAILGQDPRVTSEGASNPELVMAEVLLPTTGGGGVGGGVQTPSIGNNSFVVGFYKDGVNAREPIVMGILPNVSQSRMKPYSTPDSLRYDATTGYLPGIDKVATDAKLGEGPASSVIMEFGEQARKYVVSLPDQLIDGAQAHLIPTTYRCNKNAGEMKGIQLIIQQAVNALNFIRTQGKSFKSAASDLTGNIQSIISSATNFVSSLVKSMMKKMRGFVINKINNGIKDVLNLVSPNLRSAASDGATQANDIISCVFNKVMGTIKNIIGKILSDLLGGAVNTAMCFAENVVGSFLSQVLGDLTSALDSALSQLEGILGKAVNFAGKILDILDTVFGFLNIFSCQEELACPVVEEWSFWYGPKNLSNDVSQNLSKLMQGLSDRADAALGDGAGGIAPSCSIGPLLSGPPTISLIGGGTSRSGTGNASGSDGSASGTAGGSGATGTNGTGTGTGTGTDGTGTGTGTGTNGTGTGTGTGTNGTGTGTNGTGTGTGTGTNGTGTGTGTGTNGTGTGTNGTGTGTGTGTNGTGTGTGTGTNGTGTGTNGTDGTGPIPIEVIPFSANAVISPRGELLALDVVNPGPENYTSRPTVIVTDNSGLGNGAVVIPIMKSNPETTNQFDKNGCGNPDSVEEVDNSKTEGIGGGELTEVFPDTAANLLQTANTQSPEGMSIDKFVIIDSGVGYLSKPDGSTGAGGAKFSDPEDTILLCGSGGYTPIPPGETIQVKGGDQIFLPSGTNTQIYNSDGELTQNVDGKGPLSPIDILESGTLTTPQPPEDIDQITSDNATAGYDVVLEVNEVFIENPGINYDVNDEITVEPSNGLELEPKYDENGKLIDVKVTNPGIGFVEFPEIRIYSDTGFNANIIPIFNVLRLKEYENRGTIPNGVESISVVDCVGKIPPKTTFDRVPQ